MKVLVTGSAGFIGSHACEALAAAGHTVTGVDDLTTGRLDNWPNTVQADLLFRFFDEEPFDAIVHCAARYHEPSAWHADIHTNTYGTSILARRAAEWDARLIYLQTALCYGTNPGHGPLTLNTPLNPASSYAISKTAGEHYIRLSKCDHVIFRLANIIGPRNLTGPVPAFYRNLKAGEPCTVTDTRRDFVHIQDLAQLIVRAAEGEGRGVYHVSSGTDWRILTIHDLVALHLGKTNVEPERLPRYPDDAKTILLDPSKTRADYGWEATLPVDKAVRDACEWYDKQDAQPTHERQK